MKSSSPSRKTSARKPSHFGSKIQPSPLGQRVDALGEHRQDRRATGASRASLPRRRRRSLRVRTARQAGRCHRVFLLSPASSAGKRCRSSCCARGASFELARARARRRRAARRGLQLPLRALLPRQARLRAALRRAAARLPGVLVITPTAGSSSPETPITVDDLRAFARVPIDAAERALRGAAARATRARCARGCRATTPRSCCSAASRRAKYVDVLLGAFGERAALPGRVRRPRRHEPRRPAAARRARGRRARLRARRRRRAARARAPARLPKSGRPPADRSIPGAPAGPVG